MKRIVQIKVFKSGKYFVGSGVDVPVITQGKTWDELTKNIKEAVELYLELAKGTLKEIYNHASKYVAEEELRPHFYTN